MLRHSNRLIGRIRYTPVARIGTSTQPWIRCYATKETDEFNYNRNEFALEGKDDARDEEIARYPRVTAQDLVSYKAPPRGVKMLVRDFIQDSLYNPNYGYFSRRAEIFSPVDPIDFNDISEAGEFDAAVARLYKGYDDSSDPSEMTGRQVWHTPTELFKPVYGNAIAQCLVSEYLLKYFPYEDLVIYELGAGNGTLCLNILDFLKSHYPEVYERTRYHIVEISARLAERQKKLLLPRHSMVKITNKDIFAWNTHVPSPCYFLAIEVVDNFPHDSLRYSLKNSQPYQGLMAFTQSGGIQEAWEPADDPLIKRYLSYRSQMGQKPAPLGNSRFSPLIHGLRRILPFAPNLTQPEYVPTKLMQLLELLSAHFPLHRLLLTDFSSLPDTVEGFNAPVVQTRLKSTMVPCSTLAVQPGYFDIFFPTSFENLRDMYELILSRGPAPSNADRGTRLSPLSTTATSFGLGSSFFSSQKTGRRSPLDGLISTSGLPVGQRQSSVYTHREFMDKYADISATKLKSGENPLLDFYQNVKFLF